MMKVFLFYASYLCFPFIIALVLIIWRGKRLVKGLTLLALMMSSVFVYARFGEPHILTVHHETLLLEGAGGTSPSIRIALFSDTHFGIFKNAIPMKRIIAKVEAQNPDAVFVAGDFLYHIDQANIPEVLSPLKQLDVPVFAVLGNHDVGRPGPIYTADLYSALRALGVILVENRAHEITINGQELVIGGVSDLWQRQQSFEFTANLPNKPLILLTHNPDTAFTVPENVPFSLMLAGHTHGGQVRLPWMLEDVIPTEHPFDQGLHRVLTLSGERMVYVTTGTGMVGLPLRFNMPPRIDILTIHFAADA
jgi:predicted MPP superfamily phosphohydrolase